jgi:hypothetical protein
MCCSRRVAPLDVALPDVKRVIAEAAPAKKAPVFARLGILLTYYPARRIVALTCPRSRPKTPPPGSPGRP